ncbi:hypothetical protein C7B61_17775 [filamentous cyanobacterium CCP1]|nr:hypothetical protein C7B76_12405 [filamentous cyanobacterium CCP2]PSB60272.1 hypothetical protein C7B61_17775 [filamentous cyanobacterium CCP1]
MLLPFPEKNESGDRSLMLQSGKGELAVVVFTQFAFFRGCIAILHLHHSDLHHSAKPPCNQLRANMLKPIEMG